MEQCWRWFGPEDNITLPMIRQAGATGIVTALHDIPAGEAWPLSRIEERKSVIESAGLTWSVVESVPVHPDIMKGNEGSDRRIRAYKQTIRNLAEVGVGVICYNFMPIVDWTRTALSHRLDSGAESLRFDQAEIAAYDVHILNRPGASNDYNKEVLQRAAKLSESMGESEFAALEKNIIAGLPGGNRPYTRQEFLDEMALFAELGEQGLRKNLAHFLQQIVPVAEANGIAMAIHPDDPPFSLFGLPRIVSTADDVRALFAAIDSTANGLTLCAGSFGARGDNNLIGMASDFGSRIHFVHLRNVVREMDGSFTESDHLAGDNDIVGLVSELLEQESKRSDNSKLAKQIPMRPDHGLTIGDEIGRAGTKPGYSYTGRLKGLAELRGVITAVEYHRDRAGS